MKFEITTVIVLICVSAVLWIMMYQPVEPVHEVQWDNDIEHGESVYRLDATPMANDSITSSPFADDAIASMVDENGVIVFYPNPNR